MNTDNKKSAGETPASRVGKTVLAEMTHKEVREVKWEVAVLPFGATEPHNFHMPYGTDVFESEAVGRAACGYANERGAKVLLLPCMPFGVNTNTMGVAGGVALSVTPSTLLKVLTDLVDALTRQGIKKIVLLNSHGGNELKPLTRELYHTSKAFLCVCDWFRMAPDHLKEIFENAGEHADEMETSMGLLLFPELMDMKAAGPGKGRKSRFEAVEKKWIGITRPWHLLTEDTGVGDPSKGTAEKGKKLMDIVTKRFGDFLVELAGAEMDGEFPFEKK
jgi:creatinine amidohydrolase